MTDDEYITRAVELANGWSWTTSDMNVLIDGFSLFAAPRHYLDQPLKDALAAQLVRQIDNLDGYKIVIKRTGAEMYKVCKVEWNTEKKRIAGSYDSNDMAIGRTMNTIKTIIDAGVLQRPTED